ncbi:MAG: exonuclease [Pseudomonadota bacterium]
MSKWQRHFILDVEADGPCPGLYNMISFGLVSLADPIKSFLGEVAPVLQSPGIEEARAVSGISYEMQLGFDQPIDVMKRAEDWLSEIADGQRVTIWSDNPGFDWQYWNYYCHRFLGGNPGGFSARRIGDLDAGRRNQPLNTNAWKKRRVTDHTHNPVDDARGNAEALRWILGEMGIDL